MNILFVCEYNACRSQMAEGLARHLLPPTVMVQSAGLYPGALHEWTIDVMREIGIDISSHYSKQLEAVRGEVYDYAVVLAEPAVQAMHVIHAKQQLPWFYPDPAKEAGSAEKVKADIRSVRDAIKAQIETLALSL